MIRSQKKKNPARQERVEKRKKEKAGVGGELKERKGKSPRRKKKRALMTAVLMKETFWEKNPALVQKSRAGWGERGQRGEKERAKKEAASGSGRRTAPGGGEKRAVDRSKKICSAREERGKRRGSSAKKKRG